MCNVLRKCGRFILYSAFLFCSRQVVAQEAKSPRDAVIGAEWHSLYSTHSNFFNGVSAMYAIAFRPRWRAGLNLEYSFAPYHGDNGWKLYRLRFWPVCVDVGYAVVHTSSTALYAEVAPGLSFVRYTKQEADPAVAPYVKHERGLYLYGGMRLEENLTKNLQATFSAGLKNFHLSFDNLDVNPHGVVARAGLQYHFAAAQN